jgi:hypothetical protein
LDTTRFQSFDNILMELTRHGILQDFILIENGPLPIYEEHFKEAALLLPPSKEELSFLIPNPPRIRANVNIPELLESKGMGTLSACTRDRIKFINDKIGIEFFFVDLGKGSEGAKWIPELKIKATPVRYRHFFQTYNTLMTYKGMRVKVPEPEAFVLLKYLLIIEISAKNTEKRESEIKIAKALENFLLLQGSEEKFITYFDSMSKGWQKKLMPLLKEYESELVTILGK